MDADNGLRDRILETIVRKSNLQQKVFDNTFSILNELKETLHEMATEIDDALEERIDKRVRIEYRDRGKFEAQVQVAGEVLIFSMHTNVFEFNREHPIWKNPYVNEHPENAYCGIINIYNFLSDSFKYNRDTDLGYLIGRIFVNRQMHYFVEGKQQDSLRHDRFGSRVIDRGALNEIIERAIYYSLHFDLLVPPYDTVKIVEVDQMNTRFENSKMPTGKRLGYTFATDDIG